MPERARRRRRFRLHLLIFLLIAVLATSLFLALDADRAAQALVSSVDSLGWLAGPLFVGLHAVAVALLLPGAVFPLMAGFLFGPLGGSVLSTLGKTVGALLAFCIARYLIGGHRGSAWLDRWHARHPNLDRLETAIAEGGWLSLAMIRLIPAIPFKISSYLFGWSRVRLRDFALGTLVGTIPYSVTNAYLGSLAGSLSNLGTTPLPQSRLGWSIYLGAALLAVGASVAAIVGARRVLRREERGGDAGSAPA